MNRNQFERTERLIGRESQDQLRKKGVAVFGLGGVGSFAAEAMMRAGIGRLLLVDGDNVDVTNINRQLYALHSTVGQPKAELAKQRALQINPDAQIDARRVFFDQSTAGQFDFTQYDYVVDAIDSVTSKLLLIELAAKAGTCVISSMGAGNKLDPTRFEVADIYQTSVCPLARVMRRELRARGVAALKVVYSKEEPQKPQDGARAPGSISFVPSAAGLILAGEVIRELMQ